MFSNMFSAILNSDILPAVNETFWSGLGNVFVFIGSWFLQGLATIVYNLCKFALNLIDFMQFLVQKLAGIDMWMNLETLDLNNLKETDVVFRFLLSDTVLEVFRTMFVIFLVLLVVFTIVAIIKNEYGNAVSGGDKLNEHGKVWFTAAKAFVTVILVPFVLIVGILASNAILASLAKAFNVNNNMTLGGQIFVASAYDASSYRYYAKTGVRKYASNTVKFKLDINKDGTISEKENFSVNSVLEPIAPNSFKEFSHYTGFMFTYDGEDYYLWQCQAEQAEDYYYYIKYILGAYIVENNAARDPDLVNFVSNYNKNFVDKAGVQAKAESKYDSLISLINSDNFKDVLSLGQLLISIQKGELIGLSYVTRDGFFSCPLEYQDGSSILIDAAYNTWSYNQVLQTNISSWGDQNLTLETSTAGALTTMAGTKRDAKVVANTDSWAKLHDGGKYGFAPLAVEYMVMADVIDFMIENNVTLYYVNAANSNINYQGGGLDSGTRYYVEGSTVNGLLVDYKTEGRVAYEIKKGVNSELDGAVYIVCYFDNQTNQYIPLVNNGQVVDAKGNKYKFRSSQLNDDYRGAVIARAMFKSSNTARNCEPTYITTTMVVDQKGTDFDSKLATAVQLDYLDDYNYTYLKQLTDADADNTWLGDSYSAGTYMLENGVLTYYMNPVKSGDGTTNLEDSFTNLGTTLTGEMDDRDNPGQKITFDTTMGIIVKELCGIIENNIVEEGSTESYEWVMGSQSVSDAYVLSFKIKREDDASATPQYHTVTLTVKEDTEDINAQELVDIAGNKQLCKVLFDISITQDGAGQSLAVKDAAYVNGFDPEISGNSVYSASDVTYSPAYSPYEDDLYIGSLFSDGTNIYFYVPKTGGYNDQVFYGANGFTALNGNAFVQNALSQLTDENDANAVYKYIGTPTISNTEKTITYTVYKESVGVNSKHYTVTITQDLSATEEVSINRQEIENGDEVANTYTFLSHKFSVTIQEAAMQKPVLNSYNNNISAAIDNSNQTPTPENINYGVYNRDGYIHYFNIAESMLSANLSNSAESIAKGITEHINIEDRYNSATNPYGYKVELVEESVTYTGAVEFGINYVGNLQIKFSVKIYKESENPSDEVVYYIAQYTADIAQVIDTGKQIEGSDPADNKFEFLFNVNDSIYNTYKAYMDKLDLSSTIKRADGSDLVVTVLDLEKEDESTKYLVEADLNDSDNNKYQWVAQYKYKEVTQNSATTYTFNAVYTGVECDDGMEFITVKEANVFDQIGKNDDDYAEEKLVFILGELRAIYMPEFSFIEDMGDGNYVYYIIDTNNINPNQVNFYSVKVPKGYTSLSDIEQYYKDYSPNGETTPYAAFSYNGSGFSNLDASKAKAYIDTQGHFKVETYFIDMHGYQEPVKKEVEGEAIRYTAVLESNGGNTIAVTATNVYYGVGAYDINRIAYNFNEFLLQAEIDGETYSRAVSMTGSLEKSLDKLLEQPVSVVFCRDEMSNMHFMGDIQINIKHELDGWKFVWRAPKIGFTTIQTSNDLEDNVVVTLSRGQINLDYNFSGNVELGNVYLVTDLNWLILIFAIVLIFSILGKAVWGLIGRIYQITLLFLIMPAVASTMPLDSKGSRFDTWKNKLISQVLGTYGVTIGLNFFFILIPVIREASAIFTDADLVGLSSTLKFFVGSADRLNYLCYILFLLVAFTLLKTVPSLVQEFTGFKDAEVIKQGEDTKKGVISTVEEAGKSISGKGVIDGVNKIGGLAKPFMHPGSALFGAGKGIYDKYKAKLKGRKDAQKEAMEAARKKENEEKATEVANQKLDEANKKIQADAKQNAEASAEKQQAAVAKAVNEANKGTAQTAEIAQTADGLTTEAKQEVSEQVAQQVAENKQKPEGLAEVEKLSNDAKRYAEAAKLSAEASKEYASIATGNVHDYVGDREKAEAEAKAQEKAEKEHRKSSLGRAEEKYQEAIERRDEGKAKTSATLTKEDIERWNASHSEAEKIKKLDKNADNYKEAKREQEMLRLRARQEKYIEKVSNTLQDEKEGIKHGIIASTVRQVVGGKKTWNQRVAETEAKEVAEKELKAAQKDSRNVNKLIKQLENNPESSIEEQMKKSMSKKAQNAYKEYINSEKALGREETAEMRKEALAYTQKEATKNLQKATRKFNKAEKTVAEDSKGFLYTAGKYGSMPFKKISATADVVGKWVANKGHTFWLGHSEQDKETAKTHLNQVKGYKLQVAKAKKALENAKNEIPDQYKNFMSEYNNLRAGRKNNKQIEKLLNKNKHLLQGSSFGLQNDGKDAERFAKYLKDNGISKDKNLSKLYAHRQDEINNKVKPYQDKYNKAQDKLAQFEKNNAKTLEKARQTLGGTHIRSVGVVGEVKRGVNAAKKFVKQKGTEFVNKPKVKKVIDATKAMATKTAEMAKKATTATKNVATTAAKAVYHYSGLQFGVKTVKKVHAWAKDKQNIKKDAQAATQQNAVKHAESMAEKNKHVRDIINQTLVKAQKDNKKDVVRKLEQSLQRLKDNPNMANSGLKVAELSKLIKKYKAGSLSETEQKQIAKYINLSAVSNQSKAARISKQMQDQAAKQASRKAADEARIQAAKTAAAVEAKAKQAYQKQLQKELENAKLEAKIVGKIMNKLKTATATPSQVYKMTRDEIDKAIKDRQSQAMSTRGGANTKALISEINQLKSLVSKLKTTDTTYKSSLKKLQEANRKINKQLKDKKSKNALERATNTKNSFGEGASGKTDK